MRRVGGLLLVALVVCAGLPGAVPSAGAAAPEYIGFMDFPPIQGPAGAEEYSWLVDLGKRQELRLINDQLAQVVYAEDGLVSFSIPAVTARDFVGTYVPTTLSVTQPNILTLTVHHREGNPLAAGAPFEYPIVEGNHWENPFVQPQMVPLPPNEAELRKLHESEHAGPAPQSSAAPESTAADPPERVFVTRALGEDKLYYRPHFFLLSGDGTFGISKVQWQGYGGAVAKASGRAFANDCIPYCAAGHLYHPQANLRLSKVVRCQGRSVYARLRYVLSGRLPEGFPRRGSFSMLPLGEDGKPDC